MNHPDLPGIRIVRPLHESAASSCYLGERMDDGHAVVVKSVRLAQANALHLSLLRREFAIGARLEIAGSARYHWFGEVPGGMALVRDFVAGGSLHELYRPPLPVAEFLPLAERIARLLSSLHRARVIHCDISPHNIIADSEHERVSLIDFGVADVLRHVPDANRAPGVGSGAQIILVTPPYMAPEQTGRMDQIVDHRADLYALGVLFYRLLSGSLPLVAEDPLGWFHAHLARVPEPLASRVPELPAPLKALVMRLLAKQPDDRYQSAYGLACDLAEIREQLERPPQAAAAGLAGFVLGRRDRSAHFVVTPVENPARAAILAQLEDAYQSVIDEGRSALVALGGPAGVGKSTLWRAFVRSRAPSGDHEGDSIAGPALRCQFTPEASKSPYQTLLRCLDGLVDHILGSTIALDTWRRRLVGALGDNLGVLLAHLPRLHLVVGERAGGEGDARELARNPGREGASSGERAGSDERAAERTGNRSSALATDGGARRMQRTLSGFLGLFSDIHAPLRLLLDDLQWADPESLALIAYLLVSPEHGGHLLVATYRDEGDDTSARLRAWLSELPKSAELRVLEVAPLAPEDVERMVARAFGHSSEDVGALAAELHRKTGGLPLLVNEYLQSLYRTGHIHFDEHRGGFAWDGERIEVSDISDAMAVLLNKRVAALSGERAELLSTAACFGDSFAPELLAAVCELSLDQVFSGLWPAVIDELVLPPPATGGAYRWSHDRLREAVLARLDDEQRGQRHLRIARVLHARSAAPAADGARAADARAGDDARYAAATHYAAAADALRDADERRSICALLVTAGERALASGAPASAHRFLDAARALLSADAWREDMALALRLHRLLGVSSHFSGQVSESEQHYLTALEHAREPEDRAILLDGLCNLFTTQGRFPDAVRVGMEALAALDIQFPDEPEHRQHAIAHRLEELRELLAEQSPAALRQAPWSDDPRHHLVAQLARHLAVSALLMDPPLHDLLVLSLGRISLRHGRTEHTPWCYASLGTLLIGTHEDYAGAAELGQVAYDLALAPEHRPSSAMALFALGVFIRFWRAPYRDTRALYREARRQALEYGDLEAAAWCSSGSVDVALSTGAPLELVVAEADEELASAPLSAGVAVLRVYTLLGRQFALAWQGRTESPTSIISADLDEPTLATLHAVSQSTYGYWVSLARLYYAFGDIEPAWAALSEARFFEHPPYMFSTIKYTQMKGLLLCARASAPTPHWDEDSRAQLDAVCERLAAWADECPHDVAHKHALVVAERARVRGEFAAAAAGYERTIQGAQRQGYLQDFALGLELAGKFYRSQGRPLVAEGYLRAAREAYLRWGAKRKAEQLGLEEELARPREHGDGGAIEASTSEILPTNLDALALHKAVMRISRELVLDKLVAGLMRSLIEHAAVQTGYLILRRDGALWLEVSATVAERAPVIQRQRIDTREASDMVPRSVIDYVQRTRTRVMRSGDNFAPFSDDPYFVRHRPRAFLALPIVHRGSFSGLLYLENQVANNAFSDDRMPVLEVLAAQAAISIDNAQLYHEMEQRVRDRTRALEDTQRQLVQAARRAGMAEIAGNVLHSVGNVLNSVMTAAATLDEQIRNSRVGALRRMSETIDEHEDFVAFVRDDPRGQRLPDFLRALCKRLDTENEKRLDEVAQVQGLLDQIQILVDGQQSYATNASLMLEPIDIAEAIERALGLAGVAKGTPAIAVERVLAAEFSLHTDRHKLEQVLINLLGNAADAVRAQPSGQRCITITTGVRSQQTVFVEVRDSGGGVAPELREQIFRQGFTTKGHGHGIGLHLSAILARDLGGTLRLGDEREGPGATFVLELPRVHTSGER
ncbi:protein kinase domain-containing protein [Haliangium ochraceum]|uniref:histidine kinase n=1 Tax=Haliangium ochraceum (strain DSM 14365 / JCM 11303 / SMP-2) TaxID=502025 RepID=D0LZ21_HALO1|nr:AAA family ATPase [Haliangium ochraceum]ACY14491.1 multi-sensor signal transduction multi-kinase [Haliangium ochraceum DSM 14365]